LALIVLETTLLLPIDLLLLSLLVLLLLLLLLLLRLELFGESTAMASWL
jgi:hypothetical protein